MKDIVITSKRVKKETFILLVCFAIACALNVVGISIYKTPWIEVFTQIGYVIVISVVLYVILAFFRLILSLIRKLLQR
jgi:hypothetical protein